MAHHNWFLAVAVAGKRRAPINKVALARQNGVERMSEPPHQYSTGNSRKKKARRARFMMTRREEVLYE